MNENKPRTFELTLEEMKSLYGGGNAIYTHQLHCPAGHWCHDVQTRVICSGPADGDMFEFTEILDGKQVRRVMLPVNLVLDFFPLLQDVIRKARDQERQK